MLRILFRARSEEIIERLFRNAGAVQRRKGLVEPEEDELRDVALLLAAETDEAAIRIEEQRRCLLRMEDAQQLDAVSPFAAEFVRDLQRRQDGCPSEALADTFPIGIINLAGISPFGVIVHAEAFPFGTEAGWHGRRRPEKRTAALSAAGRLPGLGGVTMGIR